MADKHLAAFHGRIPEVIGKTLLPVNPSLHPVESCGKIKSQSSDSNVKKQEVWINLAQIFLVCFVVAVEIVVLCASVLRVLLRQPGVNGKKL